MRNALAAFDRPSSLAQPTLYSLVLRHPARSLVPVAAAVIHVILHTAVIAVDVLLFCFGAVRTMLSAPWGGHFLYGSILSAYTPPREVLNSSILSAYTSHREFLIPEGLSISLACLRWFLTVAIDAVMLSSAIWALCESCFHTQTVAGPHTRDKTEDVCVCVLVTIIILIIINFFVINNDSSDQTYLWV